MDNKLRPFQYSFIFNQHCHFAVSVSNLDNALSALVAVLRSPH